MRGGNGLSTLHVGVRRHQDIFQRRRVIEHYLL
jgi:hypothetical protein